MTGWVVAIVAAYVIGSIPFGVMIGRAHGIDIRQHGSRNIGATNVGRVLGRKFGVICFVLDFLKGALPVLLGGAIMGVLGRGVHDHANPLTTSEILLWLALAVATVLGHMFSIFLRFGGGKGVATGFGAMIAMWPLLTFTAVGAMVVWYAALRMFKYVALASMLAVSSLPLFYVLSVIPPNALEQPFSATIDRIAHGWPPLVGTTALALLVIYRHRGNIARIRNGEEPKAWEQKSPSVD